MSTENKSPFKMLSCRMVTSILMLSLGSFITGQHSLVETNDGREALKNNPFDMVFY